MDRQTDKQTNKQRNILPISLVELSLQWIWDYLGEVKNEDRMDRKFVGRVVLDSEPKKMQKKGPPKARTFTKKPKL